MAWLVHDLSCKYSFSVYEARGVWEECQGSGGLVMPAGPARCTVAPPVSVLSRRLDLPNLPPWATRPWLP